MKTGKLLATLAATMIAGAILNAQTPPATPADAKPGEAKPAETKPAEAKPAADATKAPETKPADAKAPEPAADPTKKGKPFSAIEQRSFAAVCEVLQFHMKMAERA